MLFPSTLHALILVGLFSSHLVTSNPTPGDKQTGTYGFWDSILDDSRILLETADKLSKSLHPEGDDNSPSLKHPPKFAKTHYYLNEVCANLPKLVSAQANRFLDSADKLKKRPGRRGERYVKIEAATGELLRESAELFEWYCDVLHRGKPIHPKSTKYPEPYGILKLANKRVPEGIELVLFKKKANSRFYQLCFLLHRPTMFSREPLYDLRRAIHVAQIAYYLRIRIAKDPKKDQHAYVTEDPRVEINRVWNEEHFGKDGSTTNIAKSGDDIRDAILMTEGLKETPKLQKIDDTEIPSFMEYAFVSAFTAADVPNFLPAGGKLKGTPYQTEPVFLVGQDLTTGLSTFLDRYYDMVLPTLYPRSDRSREEVAVHDLIIKMKSVLVTFGFPKKDAEAYENFLKGSKRMEIPFLAFGRSDDDSSSELPSNPGKGRIQI